jgi:hypothetical protein
MVSCRTAAGSDALWTPAGHECSSSRRLRTCARANRRGGVSGVGGRSPWPTLRGWQARSPRL